MPCESPEIGVIRAISSRGEENSCCMQEGHSFSRQARKIMVSNVGVGSHGLEQQQQQKLSVLVKMYNCLSVYDGERWGELTVFVLFVLGGCMICLIYAISDVSNLCEEKNSNTVRCLLLWSKIVCGGNLQEFF